MKNINTSRYILLLAVSGLLLSFGCSKERTLDTDIATLEQAPEAIKLEISVKDERKKTSPVKSADEAPIAPVAKKNCTPASTANSAYGSSWGNNMNSKAGAPWGMQANNQWQGMGAQQQWPSQAQNNQWGGSLGLGSQYGQSQYGLGQSQWPTSAHSAPAVGTSVVEAADCVDPGYPLSPGGIPGPAPFGYPAAPFYNPYGPYFVADVVLDDDNFDRRHRNSIDDDSSVTDDDNFSDDDNVVNDDDR